MSDNPRLPASIRAAVEKAGERCDLKLADMPKEDRWAYGRLAADIITEALAGPVGELVAERDALREGLAFYANQANYDDEGAPGNCVWASGVVDRWESDRGEIARAALAKIDATRKAKP